MTAQDRSLLIIRDCENCDKLLYSHGEHCHHIDACCVQDMGKVPGTYIAAALVPALIITVLFYFDHSVSSQLAQGPDFGTVKPPSYGYDIMLLGLMTVTCGLLGLPPVNGVIPQVCMFLCMPVDWCRLSTLCCVNRAVIQVACVLSHHPCPVYSTMHQDECM